MSLARNLSKLAALLNSGGQVTVAGLSTGAPAWDASGNLGVAGVTPSAWKSNYRAIQYGSYGSALYGRTDTLVAGISSNWYENSSGSDIYINNGYATRYQQASGAHSWLTAGSGTAGGTISFTTAMTLNASGNLLINDTSLSGSWNKALRVNGSNGSSASDAGIELVGYRTGDGDVAAVAFYNAASSNVRLAQIYGERSGANNSGALTFHTTNAGTGAEKARITPTGQLLIGKTSGNTYLNVSTAFDYQTTTFTSGAGNYGYISLPQTPSTTLILVDLTNTGNGNLNASYLLLVNTRSTSFGGGNGVTVISSTQGSTGTSGEINSYAFAISGSGTSLSLRATATIVSGSTTIQFSARIIQI